MKNSLILLLLLTFSHALIAQVGIGTVDPEARLDIVSTNSGILIPRVALTSINDVATIINPAGGALAVSTLVYNNGTGGLTPQGYYYWQNNQWNQIASTNQKQVHFGKILVSASGVINVAGVGFSPKSVEFVAINRIQGYNGTYRADGNNTNDIRMAGGMTVGYAQNNGTSIDQQVISNGFNGSSINNIGTFASSSHCIAAFFVNNNGEPIHDNGTNNNGSDTQDGLVRASLQSFNSDGFTLNFDRFLVGDSTNNRTNQIAIIYKAYR
ncbi:hypothetical protein [Leeuwenhoekiella sp. MAR_2009_132]|uniref:hypothetical protein n=1 Tax=Leeuwenhoekiella sp. MAR_2009_132 TaxID=1392489 RepID=UPI00048E23DA|nr:hypothetical protein [Leeuwenhoekiella sp. MAR_2009_132]